MVFRQLTLSRLVLFTLVFVVLVATSTPSAVAASATGSAVAVADVQRFYQVAISPNGKLAAWIGPADGASVDGIYVQSLEGQKRPTTRVGDLPATDVSDLAWSRDSKMLAFLCASGSGQSQVCVAGIDGQGVKKITDLKGDLGDPAWSPDGKQIAFLFIENAPRKPGPLEAMTPETGVIESKIYEQRLTVVDVATGAMQQISPADMYVYEFDWSPDGKQFVLTAAPGDGDNNWYIAKIYRLPAEGGPLTTVYKPPLQIANPRWSPDGKQVAFIGGLMSDEGSTGGDIFVVSAEGGEARNITPGIPASPSWLAWPVGDKVVFAERIEGDSGIATVDVASGKITQGWRGFETITNGAWGIQMSLSADGSQSAVIRHSAASPAEIWAGAPGKWSQVTHVNQGVRPEWGEMKSLKWTNEGFHVQGCLTYPVDYDPKKRYPMVVVVHGGPAVGIGSSWPRAFFNLLTLTKLGYFVLEPNPRGSYGQGEAFTRGNVKDFGYGDLRDILAGVDTVVKTLPVDNDRIGITGWSYGGFMTMWAVTQTNRFRAAVSGAGLSNWQSYYGENSIDMWMIPYFGGSVYDDPAAYAKSSAINFVKNVKTPTLILVGERDGEVPAPQSREFWHALKELGVPTQLVIYAGEGHSIHDPEHQRDIMERLTGWFEKYLK